MINISKEIRALRDFEGISREELAERSKTSRQHIWQIESVKRDPTLGKVQSILKALGYKIQIVRDK
jgi:transcriptional regulator with XRE-family HTH domain